MYTSLYRVRSDLLMVFVLQLVFMVMVRVQSVTVNKVCKPTRPGQCYTLYNDTAGPLTWIQARQLCITYNETMAIVPDPDTQQSLEQLMKIRSDMRVWMAGQVSGESVSWQTLKRNIYENSKIFLFVYKCVLKLKEKKTTLNYYYGSFNFGIIYNIY